MIKDYLSYYETPLGKEMLRMESEYLRSWLLKCSRILDIGCGPGVFERELSDLNIVGVDSSVEMIEAARQASEGEFKVVSADSLPFPDTSFDGLFFVTSLEFMKDYKRAIDEAVRVLSDRGRIVALMLNLESLYVRDKLSHGGYIAKNIRHKNVTSIAYYLSKKFNVEGRYMWGILEDRVFDSKDREYASIYAIRGYK